jgi:signal transduction histidine kinase
MSRLFPRSLFGQTLLILLVGVVVSHLAGWWIYNSDREQAVRAVGGFAAAQRITNLTRLVEEAPGDWRQRIVEALSDQTLRVSLSAQPPSTALADDDSPVAEAIKSFVVEQLSLGAERAPRVSASLPEGSMFAGWHRILDHRPMMEPGPMMGRELMMHGFGTFGHFGGFGDLQVSVPLPDGQWLTFATVLPERGPAVSRQFLVSMGLMGIIILAVSVWAVRRVTAPLASLSTAAERLGNDLNAPPIPESGTIETRQASRAFNTMQARLQSLIDNRTRMLAAISHDLRTPLTLLRLRTENVEDTSEREKMLTTIAEMDSMVGATMQFARDEATTELRRPTDVAALVQSVVDDMADAGLSVSMDPAQSVVLDCRPDALKRAIRNLIDNAVKHGQLAQVAVNLAPESIVITIEDQGPGIAEQELERVFQPFYRIDSSRNSETGGIGLGLAIALSVIQAHGGELALVNRKAGGLRASVTLPF